MHFLKQSDTRLYHISPSVFKDVLIKEDIICGVPDGTYTPVTRSLFEKTHPDVKLGLPALSTFPSVYESMDEERRDFFNLFQNIYRHLNIPTIILLSGGMGNGKSTVASELKDVLGGDNTVIMSFAERVKRIATKNFGWNGVKDEKGRLLLQYIGTEVGRAYNQDIWVEYVANSLIFNKNAFSSESNIDYVIFDDWRFENESTFWNSGSIFFPILTMDTNTFNIKSSLGLPLQIPVFQIKVLKRHEASLPAYNVGHQSETQSLEFHVAYNNYDNKNPKTADLHSQALSELTHAIISHRNQANQEREYLNSWASIKLREKLSNQ